MNERKVMPAAQIEVIISDSIAEDIVDLND